MNRVLFISTSTAISIVLNYAFVLIPEANAATFNFSFSDLIYGDVGGGSLSFTDSESSLSTTDGTGFFQLSDLGSSAAFNFSVLSSALGITHTAPASGIGPLFQFQAGNLVGLTLSDIEPEPVLDIESVLLTQGDLFLVGPGIGGVPILGASFGSINFATVQAWTPTVPNNDLETSATSVATIALDSGSNPTAAVPEPSTVFGLAVAAGLGAGAKRRWSSRRP